MTFLIEEDNREQRISQTDIKPAKLAHIVLRTLPQNVESLVEFYKVLLNAKPAYQNPNISFLRYDDEHHRLVILGVPHISEVDHRAAGLEHFAFTYSSLGELLANYCRLKECGVHPVWCINHGFTTSIYYQDPDGNMIETQFDNMENEAADSFMHGRYFDQNPIGVDFDPELLVSRYKNGDPIEDLVQFKAAPYAPGVPHIRFKGLPPYDADGDLL